ncbi:hypothetical protein BN1356_00945 [Streptococcus varani]|uniref:Uncharacterized protein n=1 Tax=Streptococcus varani TaxID=1608583 RepID=A0A0E4CSJ1_9STRE|nr:hypothetical protein BN1356_00945 [Streptococcus varani]
MTTILSIGLAAMSLLAFTAIFYGFKLNKKMHSKEFKCEVFREIAKENHKRHVMLKEVKHGRN